MGVVNKEGKALKTYSRASYHFFTWVSELFQKCVAMASDASHMLEAALEQMDDIITGKLVYCL